jgi:hypothetical protein
MYGTREGSIWKNLALAFGDGLAFGAGVNLSHNAAGRIPQQVTGMRSLTERLNNIETRIDHARRTDTLPSAFPRKAVEAVIAVVDARLREQAVQFEQRLAAELTVLRSEVAGQREADQRDAKQQEQLLRDHMTTMHSQFTESIAKLVEQKIAESVHDREQAPNQGPEPVRGEVAGLHQRTGPTDREFLDTVLALGRLCLQTAERLSAAEFAALGTPVPVPITAAPAAVEPVAASPKAFWRLPLVSSFFVVSGGLLLLHYL